MPMFGFHAYKSVAPLKPLSRRTAACLLICFHAYKSVAPLKQIEERLKALEEKVVSTLTKAWPH